MQASPVGEPHCSRAPAEAAESSWAGSTLGARLLEPDDDSDLATALRSRGRAWAVAAAAAAGAGASPRPGAGMSRSSKAVLGLSVLLTAATVAGVHLKQRQDRQVGVT